MNVILRLLCWVAVFVLALGSRAQAQQLESAFWLADVDRSSRALAFRGRCRESGDQLLCQFWTLLWQSPLDDPNWLTMLQMEERDGPGASMLCGALPYRHELLRLGRPEDRALFADLQLACFNKDKHGYGDMLARYRSRLGEICEVRETIGEVSLQRAADGRWTGDAFPFCEVKRSTLEHDKSGEWRLTLESDDVEIFDWCFGTRTNGRVFFRGGVSDAVLGLPRKCDVVLFPR